MFKFHAYSYVIGWIRNQWQQGIVATNWKLAPPVKGFAKVKTVRNYKKDFGTHRSLL